MNESDDGKMSSGEGMILTEEQAVQAPHPSEIAWLMIAHAAEEITHLAKSATGSSLSRLEKASKRLEDAAMMLTLYHLSKQQKFASLEDLQDLIAKRPENYSWSAATLAAFSRQKAAQAAELRSLALPREQENVEEPPTAELPAPALPVEREEPARAIFEAPKKALGFRPFIRELHDVLRGIKAEGSSASEDVLDLTDEMAAEDGIEQSPISVAELRADEPSQPQPEKTAKKWDGVTPPIGTEPAEILPEIRIIPFDIFEFHLTDSEPAQKDYQAFGADRTLAAARPRADTASERKTSKTSQKKAVAAPADSPKEELPDSALLLASDRDRFEEPPQLSDPLLQGWQEDREARIVPDFVTSEIITLDRQKTSSRKDSLKPTLPKNVAQTSKNTGVKLKTEKLQRRRPMPDALVRNNAAPAERESAASTARPALVAYAPEPPRPITPAQTPKAVPAQAKDVQPETVIVIAPEAPIAPVQASEAMPATEAPPAKAEPVAKESPPEPMPEPAPAQAKDVQPEAVIVIAPEAPIAPVQASEAMPATEAPLAKAEPVAKESPPEPAAEAAPAQAKDVQPEAVIVIAPEAPIAPVQAAEAMPAPEAPPAKAEPVAKESPPEPMPEPAPAQAKPAQPAAGSKASEPKNGKAKEDAAPADLTERLLSAMDSISKILQTPARGP
jgi:hypothetical protein